MKVDGHWIENPDSVPVCLYPISLPCSEHLWLKERHCCSVTLTCSLCVCLLLGKLAFPSPLCLPNGLIDSEGSNGGSRAGSLAQVNSKVVCKPLVLHFNGPSLGQHLLLTCCCIDLIYPVVDLLPLSMVDLSGCEPCSFPLELMSLCAHGLVSFVRGFETPPVHGNGRLLHQPIGDG